MKSAKQARLVAFLVALLVSFAALGAESSPSKAAGAAAGHAGHELPGLARPDGPGPLVVGPTIGKRAGAQRLARVGSDHGADLLAAPTLGQHRFTGRRLHSPDVGPPASPWQLSGALRRGPPTLVSV